MTHSDVQSSLWIGTRTDKEKTFCVDHCPHPNERCKGDCPERRAFAKTNRKRRAERR